jgi:hypothetical protein
LVSEMNEFLQENKIDNVEIYKSLTPFIWKQSSNKWYNKSLQLTKITVTNFASQFIELDIFATELSVKAPSTQSRLRDSMAFQSHWRKDAFEQQDQSMPYNIMSVGKAILRWKKSGIKYLKANFWLLFGR